jgi:hypothetical protein
MQDKRIFEPGPAARLAAFDDGRTQAPASPHVITVRKYIEANAISKVRFQHNSYLVG